jgi:SAM-dependent methyltransferase
VQRFFPTMMIDHDRTQDFEEYARAKPFNLNVADTWQSVIDEAIERAGKVAADLTLLDYGCGDGKYFRIWNEYGVPPERIHGLDVAQLRIDRCRALGWVNARVIERKKPLPYADGSFDMVNCMEVVEHIPAAEGARTLGEIRRILRPGGFLLISTPNYPIKRLYDICDAIFHRKWSRLRDDPTHVTFFNHERLHELLDPLFSSVEERIFKTGFLYRRFPHPRLLHKLFFLCRA